MYLVVSTFSSSCSSFVTCKSLIFFSISNSLAVVSTGFAPPNIEAPAPRADVFAVNSTPDSASASLCELPSRLSTFGDV